jgi:hypothetical protein
MEEMKKLIVIFAVLLLAAPAFAADWAFFGSQRVTTFYVQDDYGDFEVNGQGNDWGLNWNFQTNSRLGAKVKADKVTGFIELGLKGTDGGDIDVGTRRAYGSWKFMDDSQVKGGAHLKVGKDYSPVTRFLSGQVFGEDVGLLGLGDFYGRRPGQLGLEIGNFQFAAITNALNTSGYAAVPGVNGYPAAPGVAPAGSDPDWNLPKIEASYMLKFGSFDIRPFGGLQYFKVSEGASILTDNLEVWSYVVGIDSMVNIGAFYVGGQVSYGQNWGNANWSGPLVGGSAGSFATLDGTNDVNDTTSWMAMLVTGLKFTDTLKFEVGGGYLSNDPDVSGADSDDAWTIYGQTVITLAPGVYLIPEVGYLDKMDNFAGNNEGYQWYAGAKWQIDF